jgi:hypothetical protein
MENRSNAVAAAGSAADANSVLQIGEDRRLARQVHKDLHVVGMSHTNLLLVGTAGAFRLVLEMLWLELREPIVTWRPGQPLELPLPGRAATLVLHDVGELTYDDQHRVLRWLERAAGQIRVVSTTTMPLWPRVKAGAFNETLYYRLNTVCVNVGM